jgi:hypothetical protein
MHARLEGKSTEKPTEGIRPIDTRLPIPPLPGCDQSKSLCALHFPSKCGLKAKPELSPLRVYVHYRIGTVPVNPGTHFFNPSRTRVAKIAGRSFLTVDFKGSISRILQDSETGEMLNHEFGRPLNASE